MARPANLGSARTSSWQIEVLRSPSLLAGPPWPCGNGCAVPPPAGGHGCCSTPTPATAPALPQSTETGSVRLTGGASLCCRAAAGMTGPGRPMRIWLRTLQCAGVPPAHEPDSHFAGGSERGPATCACPSPLPFRHQAPSQTPRNPERVRRERCWSAVARSSRRQRPLQGWIVGTPQRVARAWRAGRYFAKSCS